MAETEAPQCCGEPMIPIAYGMPGPEMMEAADRGEIELGGCVIWDEKPTYVCRRCERQIGRLGDVWDDQPTEDG